MLYCGRVHLEKGLDLLMKAAHKLPTGWSAEIVGPWESSAGGGGEVYMNELKRLAGDAPVTFHGPVFDPDRLNTFYKAAAIFAYPSVAEQGETFGLAPLEAMAWGCVPVVSSLECFSDFITHERNGLVFNHRLPGAAEELAGSMNLLTTAAERRKKLAFEAMRVRESHSPTQICEKFLSSFAQI